MSNRSRVHVLSPTGNECPVSEVLKRLTRPVWWEALSLMGVLKLPPDLDGLNSVEPVAIAVCCHTAVPSAPQSNCTDAIGYSQRGSNIRRTSGRTAQSDSGYVCHGYHTSWLGDK